MTFPLILLCGGASARMGTPKGLLEINGRPWILEQTQQFRAAGGNEVVVVLGFNANQYRAALGVAKDVTIVVNEHPEHGQFSSLQTGCNALTRKKTAAFCLPVDVPAPKSTTWKMLTKTLAGEIDVCIPTWKDRGGHPVLLSARLIKKLLTIPLGADDARLDRQIHQLPRDRVARIPVDDERVVMNINTPADIPSL